MLDIYEATTLIDKLKKENIKIKGLLISNSANKNYGRTYVRTNLDFDVDIILFPDQTYVSYRIDHTPIDKERQKDCNRTLEEQKNDIKILTDKILSLYPNAEVYTILSSYFCFAHSETIITGDIIYSDVNNSTENKEIKRSYIRTLEYLEHQKSHYQHILKWVRKHYK